jgi:hypothetical protein
MLVEKRKKEIANLKMTIMRIENERQKMCVNVVEEKKEAFMQMRWRCFYVIIAFSSSLKQSSTFLCSLHNY